MRRSGKGMVVAVVGVLLSMFVATPAIAGPLAPPGAVSASTLGPSQIHVRWSSSAGATSYRVLRADSSGGPYALVGTTSALEFVNGGLAPARTYFYVVQAAYRTKVSGYSNQASATTTFLRPTGVRLAATRSTVDVSWDPVPGAVRYELLRSGPYEVDRPMGATTATTWTDGTVADNTNYEYAVRAVASNGVTGTSDHAGGRTGAPTTTTLTLSPPRSEVGQSVLLSATVRLGDGAATGGDVWFMYGNSRIGLPVPVDRQGRAETVVTLGSAPITLFARYTGNAFSSTGASASGNIGHVVDPAYGSLSFQPAVATAVGGRAVAVTTGDITGDGLTDAVLTTGEGSGQPTDHSVFIFAQQADHTLAPARRYATTTPAGGDMVPVVGDTDGDGRNELLVASGDGVDIFRHAPDGLAAPTHLSFGTGVWDLQLLDLDGDGPRDVVVMTASGVLVRYGSGGGFAPASTVSPLWGTLAVADVTGDTRRDLVLLADNAVQVLDQTAPRTFAAPARFAVPTGYWPLANSLAVGDLTGDGRADIAVTVGGNTPGSRVQVLTRDAAGVLGAWAVYPVRDAADAVTLADLNVDGRLDVLTTHRGWVLLGVQLQRLDGRLGRQLTYQPWSASDYLHRGIVAGDVSGDGRPDILLADPEFGLVVRRQ